MLLGISSFAYGWAVGIEGNRPGKSMTELELVEVACEFGLRCLQIGDNLPIHTFGEERLEAFGSLIRKKQMRLEIGARELTAPNLRRYIELAERLEAPLLRFVIDGDEYKPRIASVLSLIKDHIAELAEKKLTLGIENHDRFKARQLASMIEQINSPWVGVCLDCANSIGAGEGLEHVAAILAPFTVNVHVKDFNIERLSHKMGFIVTGARAGSGLAEIAWLLEKVGGNNRCQSAILEQWVPPEGDITATIRKESAWARDGVKYLKGFDLFA